ncbi:MULTISPECIES: DUF1499 domain-containing protein [unclassified Marinovum]
MLKLLVIILLLMVGSYVFWMRLAPQVPERWHRKSEMQGLGVQTGKNSHVYREAAGANGAARLAAFDAVIRATLRTEVLAGALAQGQITYVTRSKVIGYPDYTTLGLYDGPEGDFIEVFSRARFGSSDLGVNRARIDGWLEVLRQGGA